MAHKIAQVMDISPWDALLLTVKKAAAWVAFYHGKLAEVENDEDLLPNGPAHAWLEGAERTTQMLARFSKMAVDAGVAKLLVERAQAEGALLARVMNRAITEAGLDEGAEQRLRAALRAAIMVEQDVTPLPAGETPPGEDLVADVD